MAGLGETSDPIALIPGDPAAIFADAGLCAERSTRFNTVADCFAALRTGSWQGSAADAFWSVMETLPKSWRVTADAFSSVAAALTSYAHTLAAAQAQAGEAIARWDEGQAATEAATATYNSQVSQYNTSIAAWRAAPVGVQPTAPAVFTDPGSALRAEAEEILSAARACVVSAGDRAASAIAETVVSNSSIASSSGGDEDESETSDQLITIDPVTGEVKIGFVGVDGSVSWYTASAEVQERYGSLYAKAGADFDLFSADGSAGVGIDDGALSAEASGSANLVGGSAGASAGGEHAHVGVDAEGSIGAYGEAGITIGADGAGASLGGFVGGKASIGGEIEVGGVTEKLTAEGWIGVGAELDVGITHDDDDGTWTIGIDVGAAVGLGFEISPEITIDPAAVGDAISDAIDWLGGF